MASRRGLGSVKHIETGMLWIQEAVRVKKILLDKVNTKDNPADAMTKHLDRQARNKHMAMMGIMLE